MTPYARLATAAIASLTLNWLATATATADVVTGSVTPQGARVVIVNSGGATVATLPAGPYQLQLPVGKYRARCESPKQHEQEFLSLSEPVTVNIDCS